MLFSLQWSAFVPANMRSSQFTLSCLPVLQTQEVSNALSSLMRGASGASLPRALPLQSGMAQGHRLSGNFKSLPPPGAGMQSLCILCCKSDESFRRSCTCNKALELWLACISGGDCNPSTPVKQAFLKRSQQHTEDDTQVQKWNGCH